MANFKADENIFFLILRANNIKLTQFIKLRFYFYIWLVFHNNDKLKLMKNFSLFLEDTAFINAKQFLLGPIKHYRQVNNHDKESKKKEKVSNIQPPSSFFKKCWVFKSVAEGQPSTTSPSSSSTKTASLQSKKPILSNIRNMDPKIDLKQNPTNDLQKWAVGIYCV